MIQEMKEHVIVHDNRIACFLACCLLGFNKEMSVKFIKLKECNGI
jgi:hypothetical protein